MEKHCLLLTLILLIITPQLFAMPAMPWPVEKVLPDGTVVSVYIRGDERVHWMESMDGYTLMYNLENDIVYATKDNEGNMIPSDVLYMGDAAKSLEIDGMEKGLRFSKDQVNVLLQLWQVGQSGEIGISMPVLGDRKALCILVDFTDRTFIKSIEQFEMLMNQVGYSDGSARGSVKDYYREVSYGKMDLTVTVAGVYTLPNTCAYYAKENNYWEFARTAITMADNDIDFNDFANEEGWLETVHIIYAGFADNVINNGQQIWPHKWNVYPSFQLDGVNISTYSCSSELRNASGTTICGIGTTCHELCHVFGAPDYYDTDYAGSGGSFPGTGSWDLMASGGHNGNGDVPAHINMVQKIMFGWVDPVFLTEPTAVTAMPNSAENDAAYVIEVNTDEYYVLENRQQLGFDAGVQSHGMIVYHVHPELFDDMRWRYNNINATHPQLLYIVSGGASALIPNSSPSSYSNYSRAPFGVRGYDTFSSLSVPVMFTWEDMSYIPDKGLSNIVEENKLIFFDFGMEGSEDCPTVQNLNGYSDETTIYLSWDAPNEDQGYTYSVRYNGKIAIEGLTDTEYAFSLPTEGTYACSVVASIGDCVSYPVCTTVLFAPLKFVSTFPERTSNIAIDIPLSFVFNKNIIDDDLNLPYITDDSGLRLDNVTAEVSGAKLNLYHPVLEYSSQYHVTVPAGTIRNMNTAINWSFSTRSLPIEITNTSPANGAVEAPLNTELKATFNQNVVGRLPHSITIIADGGQEKAINSVRIENGTVLYIKHDDLEKNTTYTVTIGKSTIKDMEEDYSWSFTTVETVGIEEVLTKAEVFPTVTDGALNIVVDGKATVGIMDLSGRLLESHVIENGSGLMLDYANGVYLLNIETPSGTSVHKIIIKK